MILGIGNDIVEVERIRRVIKRYGQRFLNRLFTTYEQNYCLRRKDPALHFAGRFAAKEAVVKAFGTGFTKAIGFLDVEIMSNKDGKPGIVLSPIVDQLMNYPKICISISHCHTYATAIAIWQN